MKIHEYQARQLLLDAGVSVPRGEMAESVAAAQSAARALFASGSAQVVVKAQVHAGGRGKAGFVKLVRTVDEAVDAATFMLGNRMVSVQTGPEGIEVRKLLIADAVEIAHEYYVAVLVDRGGRVLVLDPIRRQVRVFVRK